MAFNLVDAGRRIIGNTVSNTLLNNAFQSTGSKVSESGQPQLAFMWEVSFRGIFSSNAKNIKFYAKSANLPAVAVEPIRRFYAGVPYAYSGKDNSPRSITIAFWDNQSLDIYRYFLQWMNSMNDVRTKRKARPQNYKRDITLNLKDTTDGFITGDFGFTGCFPTEVTEVALSYDDSNVMEFSVTFTFDETSTSGDVISGVIETGIGALANATGAGNLVSTAIEGFRGWF